MKQKSLLKVFFLLCALIVGSTNVWGQAEVNTVLWAEDFSGFSSGVPSSNSITNSHTGTTVYGGVTLTYECTNGSGTSTTQVYTSGGPNGNNNLLIAKSNGTFSISGISTGSASEITVTYSKSGSGTVSISSSTTGVTISGSASGSTITTNGASLLQITFKNTASNNLRIDDISLTVKTAGASKTNVGTFSTISDQAVTKGSSIDFDPSDYYTDDAGVTGTTTFTVTPTSGDIYYSEGKIYATTYGSQEFTVTATPADADKSKYKAVSTTFTANCADTRTTPTFNLSATSINLKVNETSSAVSLTTNSDGTVSFACEDAHVTLTGTGNSRTISANAAGEYTVNVSVTGSDTYKDAAGTITVNVTKKATTMVLTPTFTSKDLKDANSGSVTGVPQYNSTNVEGATVTYESSDTKVATIASNGTITFKKAGTTTITVSYEGDDEYEACEAEYELTLVDTRPQETTVNITFNNALYGTSFTGANAAGDGPVSGTVNNVSVEADQGTAQNFYINDSETRIYNGGTVTISAPTGYYLAKIVVTTSSKWSVSASPGTLSSTTWTGSAQEVVFSASDRSDFKSATITLAPTVTIPGTKYLSYCSPHKLDFTESDVKAYKASVDGEGNVTLTKVDVVPAEEGVVLHCETPGTYAVPVTDASASDVTGNQMVGVLERTQVLWNPSAGVYNYILQSGNFNKASDGYLKPNRAYLSTSYNVEGAGAKPLTIIFADDETDGIKAVSTKVENGVRYNLAGQKVGADYKGIVIVNGKKFVIK